MVRHHRQVSESGFDVPYGSILRYLCYYVHILLLLRRLRLLRKVCMPPCQQQMDDLIHASQCNPRGYILKLKPPTAPQSPSRIGGS